MRPLKGHYLLVVAGVSPVEQGDAAVDGVDVGEGVAVDGEDVSVEARRKPTLTVREVARGGCVVGRCGQRRHAVCDQAMRRATPRSG